MTTQNAAASIAGSSSVTAPTKVVCKSSASIAGASTLTATLSILVKLGAVPRTGGFAGIDVDPTPYVVAAGQYILAAIQDASNPPLTARAVLVNPPVPYGLPYVNIYGVPGSALALRTGGTTSQLPPQLMISAIGAGLSQTYGQVLWQAVANYLFNINPSLLHADGFQTTVRVRTDGADVLEPIT